MLNGLNVLRGLRLSIEEKIYAEDPAYWMECVIGEKPDPWQKKVLQSKELEIILNCCRQSGKTETAAVKASHTARYKKGTLTVVISPTQRQSGILQRRVNRFLGMANDNWQKLSSHLVYEYSEYEDTYKIVRRSVLSLELANESRVVSVPASPDTVRGYSPDLIIGDESAFIEDAVYAAVRPMRAAKPVQLIIMSTPKGKAGFFYDEWISKDPVWLRIKVSADDCPRISKKFLEREKDKLGKDFFEREYYNRFLEIEGSIFDQDMIDSLFKLREPEEEIAKTHKTEKALIDPGGFTGWR